MSRKAETKTNCQGEKRRRATFDREKMKGDIDTEKKEMSAGKVGRCGRAPNSPRGTDWNRPISQTIAQIRQTGGAKNREKK